MSRFCEVVCYPLDFNGIDKQVHGKGKSVLVVELTVDFEKCPVWLLVHAGMAWRPLPDCDSFGRHFGIDIENLASGSMVVLGSKEMPLRRSSILGASA